MPATPTTDATASATLLDLAAAEATARATARVATKAARARAIARAAVKAAARAAKAQPVDDPGSALWRLVGYAKDNPNPYPNDSSWTCHICGMNPCWGFCQKCLQTCHPLHLTCCPYTMCTKILGLHPPMHSAPQAVCQSSPMAAPITQPARSRSSTSSTTPT